MALPGDPSDEDRRETASSGRHAKAEDSEGEGEEEQHSPNPSLAIRSRSRDQLPAFASCDTSGAGDVATPEGAEAGNGSLSTRAASRRSRSREEGVRAKSAKVSTAATSDDEDAGAGEEFQPPPPPTPKRLLRKRKVDLNKLSSSLGGPAICQVQYCGIRLKDGDSLDWHYQAHLAREIERLNKVRPKKLPKDFPDRHSRNLVRQSAFERIRFRREARLAQPIGESQAAAAARLAEPTGLRCPVCEEVVEVAADGDGEDDDDDPLSRHVEVCLRVAPPPTSEVEAADDEDDGGDDLDVDGDATFEEYEWAGQRRVRATSLVEGGLRGAGFLTIQRGNEDEELDIENDLEERQFGRAQYSDRDIVLPEASTEAEETERRLLRAATLGQSGAAGGAVDDADDQSEDGASPGGGQSKPDSDKTADELLRELSNLRLENNRLRSLSTCNVCMDEYSKPLTSVSCWHVLCERCWLRALGAKKLCPQCKVITRPEDLRRVYV